MKRISYFLVFLAICIHTPLSAQEKKSTTDNVTVTATGEGITKDDAKQNALRNAIELAFGTFVSSKIEVLNDDLIKDEIITVSNGNIQKFDVLSEVQMPDNSFAVTVNAIVSISKLTSFCESKGVTVEFKGSLFAMNVRLQEFNEKNEEKAIDNLCEIIKKISETSFKYYIWTKQPLKCGELWQVPIIVQVGMNENFNNIPDLMYNTIKGLSMNFDEVKNYNDLNKFVYPLSIGLPNNISGYFFLRNKTSVKKLIQQIFYFSKAILNFKIENGIDEMNIQSLYEKQKTIRAGKLDTNNLFIWNPISFFMANNDLEYWNTTSLFHTISVPSGGGVPRQDSYLELDYSSLSVQQSNFLFINDADFIHTDAFPFLNKLKKDFEKKYKGSFKTTDYKTHNYEYKYKGAFIPGVVISFCKASTENDPLVAFIKCADYRTIDEIEKITEYKITPNKTNP